MTLNNTISRPRRTALIAGGVLAAFLTAAVVWFLGRGSPVAVDIDSAADDVTATQATGDNASAASVEGTWSVDTTVAEFSVAETAGTFVGFRIQEELANIGVTEAVGRTPQVSGHITIDGTTLTAAEFTADMTAIVSNEPRRDDKIQSALETGTYPTATFELTEPAELANLADGDVILDGNVIHVEVTGTIAIHGVTQPVTVQLQAVSQDGTIVVTGSFDVVFADFEVAVPTAPIVLSVEDHGVVELQLYFTRS